MSAERAESPKKEMQNQDPGRAEVPKERSRKQKRRDRWWKKGGLHKTPEEEETRRRKVRRNAVQLRFILGEWSEYRSR